MRESEQLYRTKRHINFLSSTVKIPFFSLTGLAVAVAFGLAAAAPCAAQLANTARQKPNVLFIAVDDMNDWITPYGGPIKTPNIDRLARRGMLFRRAYCASPACNPSRAAVMTGLRPSSTGVYANGTDWRRALPDAATIPQHFMQSGYWAEGAGKIFHHHNKHAFHDNASFHHFLKLKYDDYPDEPLNGITNWVGGRGGGPTSAAYDWGPWMGDEENTPDVRTVNYAVDFLKQKHDSPFFFAAGIFRPHMPHFAPMEYFEKYPLETLAMPEVLEDDLDDLPTGGLQMLEEGKPFLYKTMVANNKWRQAVQAYQACATFADAQIGRLLDELDRSPYADNTIIVLWSDNGFHVGEKKHWEKFALWEKTTRTPFVVVAPGATKPGSVCETPVSLLDIYPTLIDLCGLPKRSELEGNSLMPLLTNPDAVWDQPAVMTYGKGNHAVRSKRWRYIHYSDGSEELYDQDSDPNDSHNLAGKPEYGETIEELKKWLPQKNVEQAANMVSWRAKHIDWSVDF
jgi:arylsulfatase A-like enzyme